MQELTKDSVKYNIYMSLVHEKKLISEEDFWRNDELLESNNRNIREEYDKCSIKAKTFAMDNRQRPAKIEL
jgi:hypothetical protein